MFKILLTLAGTALALPSNSVPQTTGLLPLPNEPNTYNKAYPNYGHDYSNRGYSKSRSEANNPPNKPSGGMFPYPKYGEPKCPDNRPPFVTRDTMDRKFYSCPDLPSYTPSNNDTSELPPPRIDHPADPPSNGDYSGGPPLYDDWPKDSSRVHILRIIDKVNCEPDEYAHFLLARTMSNRFYTCEKKVPGKNYV